MVIIILNGDLFVIMIQDIQIWMEASIFLILYAYHNGQYVICSGTGANLPIESVFIRTYQFT